MRVYNLYNTFHFCKRFQGIFIVFTPFFKEKCTFMLQYLCINVSINEVCIMDNNINSLDQNTENKNKQVKKPLTKAVKIIIFTGLGIFLSALFVGLGLLWQWRFDLLGIINAFYLSGAVLFSFGFIIYASNESIFAPFIYGTKSFFTIIFAGRRPKLTYYDYLQDQKNHKFPRFLIYYPMLVSAPNLLVAIILHIYFNMYIYQPL